MRPLAFRLGILGAAFAAAACAGNPSGPPRQTDTTPAPQPDPLRKILQDRNIRIGIGVAVGQLFHSGGDIGRQYDSVLAREFNLITPENDLKFGPLRPARGEFRYARADDMLAFAQANGMKMRGHTLAWHNQLAAWLTGGTWPTDTVRVLLDEHITAVVTHFKGKLAAWDVVNEAFTDTPVQFRGGFWSDRLGRAYVEQAFRTARAADPDVPLYYNDYNIEGVNAKSDSVYALLQDFKTRGVPVDGIGMQMHLLAGQIPARNSIEQNFARFAALGLKIQITELDIRVPLPSTGASLDTQAQDYRMVFDLCISTPACEMVVMWGFTDRASWIPGTFPGFGDALLFDANFNPKPAYNAVRALLLTK